MFCLGGGNELQVVLQPWIGRGQRCGGAGFCQSFLQAAQLIPGDGAQVVGQAAPGGGFADIALRALPNGQGTGCEIEDAGPVLLPVQQLGPICIRFAQVRRFCNGPQQPIPGGGCLALLFQRAGDIAHGGRPLVGPPGGGHG